MVGCDRVRDTRGSGSSMCVGGGLEEVEELERERAKRKEHVPRYYTERIANHQHRTAFCALKHAHSGYQPALSMGNGLWIDDSSGVLGKKDCTLPVGPGRVRGGGSSSSSGK